MATVYLPLPDRDFDVTEVAVPWKGLVRAGHRVLFATETGSTPACDPLLVGGVIFGQLGAEPEPLAFYRELEADPAFRSPVRWSDVPLAGMDALLLAGGHAPGMRQYLGSPVVQEQVRTVSARGVPIAAICHGVLVAARAGILRGRKTTCLPKYMERTAYFATAWLRGRYYRTYPEYVEDEVRAALASPADFVRGPVKLFRRGTAEDDGPAFVVEDGPYVSGRWPGDAYLLAKKLLERL